MLDQRIEFILSNG